MHDRSSLGTLVVSRLGGKPCPPVADRVKQKHGSGINVTAIQDEIAMTFCAFVCFLVRAG